VKPLLLWTERPVRLAREEPTHAWMIANRPWEALGLELVYDNLPGGWPHYAQVFRRVWERAGREGRLLIVIESDIVPTMDSFRQLITCPESVCVFPYLNPLLGEGARYGTVIERRVPGGWESRFGGDDDKWAVDADLGLCRFDRRALARPWPAGDINGTGHTPDGVLINTALFRLFRTRDGIPRIHVHRPPVVNSHIYWDRGDDAHHPPERKEEMHRIHDRWLDPALK
jgi:hypothetical protein